MRLQEGNSLRRVGVTLAATAAYAGALAQTAPAQTSGEVAGVTAALDPVPDVAPAQLDSDSQAIARHLAWRVLQADRQFPENDKDQFTDAPRRTTLDEDLRMRSVMIRSQEAHPGLYGLHVIIELQRNAKGKKVLLPRNVREVNLVAENTHVRSLLGLTSFSNGAGWVYTGERTTSPDGAGEKGAGASDSWFEAVTNPVQVTDRQITTEEVRIFETEANKRIDAATQRKPFGPLWMPLKTNPAPELAD